MRSIKKAGLATALVLLGAFGAMGGQADAFNPVTDTVVWTTGPVMFIKMNTNVQIRVYNANGPLAENVTVTAFETLGGAVTVNESVATPGPIHAGTQKIWNAVCTGANCIWAVRVQAKQFGLMPSLVFTSAAPAADDHQIIIPSGGWQQTVRRGSNLDIETELKILDRIDGATAAIPAINSTVASISDTVGNIDAKNGNFTRSFCAEGSVRNDSQGVLQMYVTLFSRTAQAATINYVTNFGTFPKIVNLQAGVRFTDDVNAFLLKGGVAATQGKGDVDTSVEVVSTAPLFLACPVYFDRTIGDAGRVNGGTVQDGSHN